MILSLDSSTSQLSLALVRRGETGEVQTVGERTIPDGGKHGTQLPLAIAALLDSAHCGLEDLTAVIAGLGPGSFTGLRVGLATLKGLCYARQLPIAGGSSLQALAREAAERRASPLWCALLDARHGELYAGLFDRDAQPLAPEVSLPPERLAAWLESRAAGELPGIQLVGEGASVYRAQLSASFPAAAFGLEELNYPSAAQLAGLVLRQDPFPAANLFALEPHYVRPSEAEIRFPEGNFKPRSLG